MRHLKKVIATFIIVITVFLSTIATNAQQVQGLPTVDAKTSAIWKAIKPYFSPPQNYKGRYGDYRSPLVFYNSNDTVQTKHEWKIRRDQIRNQWMHMMGEWPPLLKDQELKILETTQKKGFTRHRIRFNWLPDKITEGYLLIPDGGGKRAAVIIVYYEPETAIGLGKPNRDFALQLTKRGFVTLSIGTTQATEAGTYSLYYPSIENAQVEPLSMLAYAAANAWYVLSKVPEVDSSRIGIMGHSFGGKWAMFASCLFDKFAAAVWSDPGIIFDESEESANYWAPWYLGYYPPPWKGKGWAHYPEKGLYPKLRAKGHNLQELHALMAPRPFLVSGGAVDNPNSWFVLNYTRKVNRLLGYKDRVALTNRKSHSPTPRSNQIAYLFFEYFLDRNGIKYKIPPY